MFRRFLVWIRNVWLEVGTYALSAVTTLSGSAIQLYGMKKVLYK